MMSSVFKGGGVPFAACGNYTRQGCRRHLKTGKREGWFDFVLGGMIIRVNNIAGLPSAHKIGKDKVGVDKTVDAAPQNSASCSPVPTPS
jgi:hypothetical protein